MALTEIKIIKKPKTNGANTVQSGIITPSSYQTPSTANADYAARAGHAETASAAEEARHAQSAVNLDPDSPVRGEFISRIADDVARGHITFEQGLTAVGLAIFRDGAQFGEYIQSMYSGHGAGIDKDGNAEFESVRVRSYFECFEYIINRLSVIEGDQLLTEGDTIDRVEWVSGNRFRLTLREKWGGYHTAQKPGNILRGIFNTLEEGEGMYLTSWLLVRDVDAANNILDVFLYDFEEVPGGMNIAPMEGMTFARWGNEFDKTRQSCLYFSSTEGRIVKLTNVTSPKIDKTNYGTVLGDLPEFIKEMNLPLIDGQDYLYARGIVVEDILRIDYQGRPVVDFVDRGAWSAEADYYCEALNPLTRNWETSDVWHNNAKYRCLVNSTKQEPAKDSTDWQLLMEGSKGEKGSVLRGPQAWNDCPVGYTFESGGDGQQWKDVVLYEGNFYSCVNAHIKTDHSYPGGPESEKYNYWRLGDAMELVATKILLASYSVVKNLGVETIDMRDSAGNIIFQAKDGEVTCRKGSFENVEIKGAITATSYDMSFSNTPQMDVPNGTVCLHMSAIRLPEIPQGVCRTIRILNPVVAKNYSPSSLTVIPDTENVRICPSPDLADVVKGTQVVLPQCGFNSGSYWELLGLRYGDGDTTTWHLIRHT